MGRLGELSFQHFLEGQRPKCFQHQRRGRNIHQMKYFRIFTAFKPIGLNSMMMKWVSFSIKFWKPLKVSFLLHCFSVYQIFSPMNIEFDTKKESDSPSECTRRLGLYFLHRQGTPQVKEMVSSKPISTAILKKAKNSFSSRDQLWPEWLRRLRVQWRAGRSWPFCKHPVGFRISGLSLFYKHHFLKCSWMSNSVTVFL